MDRDTIEGKAKQGSGTVKEAWGDLTDDERAEAEGRKDQVEGKVQESWGRAKERVDDLSRHEDEKEDELD